LPVTRVTKFLTSLSLDLLFFLTILTSLRYIFYATIPISAVLFFTETVFCGLGLVLEGAGLGLGLETTGLGLGTLVLTTRLLIAH